MDKEETAAPFSKGEEMVVMANMYLMTVENNLKIWTHLSRTNQLWKEMNRLKDIWNNQNYNEVKDNSVKKDLELKFNIWLFCC